ncbi:MAG: tetratricopeptide repeat protein [Chitinophagales bacterium]|nr:tetratricopeptide repeat protein [Chitinophagales bacterium]
MRQTKIPVFTIVCVLLLFAGCTAERKAPFLKQTYHDITARNNAYFNADLKLETIRENVENSRIDDYSKILPIYTDRDPELAKSYTADLDSVIKKTSDVIRKHEVSIHTDNSYFLVGVSHYLKGNFQTAQETFQYVNAVYKPKPEVNKKKSSSKGSTGSSQPKSKGKPQSASQKEDATSGNKAPTSSKSNKGKPLTAGQKAALEKEAQEKAEKEAAEKKALEEKKAQEALLSGNTEETEAEKVIDLENKKGKEDPLHWLKHQPVRPDAMIWLVDCYTSQKKYREAEAVLTLIDADEQFPSWLFQDVEMARANLYLQKGDLDKAIAPLTRLTKMIKKKKNKARFNYILAQIYESQHDNALAIGYYQQVLEGKPKYDMSFNAKMNIARISVKDNSLPTDDVVKILKRLLRDSKNSEFYDQVYFALAELNIKENKLDEAVKNYKKSVAASTTNTNQKALSFLRLGEIYFDQEKYELSQPYYDSTIAILQPTHAKYAEVEKRNNILKNLVTQINTITLQDSLLKLSTLSDKELEKVLQAKLDKLQQEEEEKAQQQTFLQPENTSFTDSKTDGGTWIFDNPGAKATGYNDFIRKWGKRKLEDNWRRSNKASSDEALEEKVTEEDTKETGKEKKEELSALEKLKKTVPSSDKDIKQSRAKVIEAYYLLGTIYYIDLKNYAKAIATFEELLQKYPGDHKYVEETYYNLYLLYTKQGDLANANKYKDLLLGKYAGSKYAKIIQNPNYLQQEKEMEKAESNYYTATYQYFAQGAMDSVIARVSYADTLFGANYELKPKFALLQALAIGKSKDLGSYKTALQDVVTKYPGHEAKIKAQEILDYINKSTDSTIRKENNMLRYEYSAESRHFFLLSINSDSIKVPDVVNAIGKYNEVNRSMENLKVEPLIMPDGYTIVTVKSFENLMLAKDYYNAIISSDAFAAFPKQALNFYLISDINLNKVIMNKEIGSYFEYFNLKYPQ